MARFADMVTGKTQEDRQRRIVGPWIIGGIIQALLVGLICAQYWRLSIRSKRRPTTRLHIFLASLVVLNVTNGAITFSVGESSTLIYYKSTEFFFL